MSVSRDTLAVCAYSLKTPLHPLPLTTPSEEPRCIAHDASTVSSTFAFDPLLPLTVPLSCTPICLLSWSGLGKRFPQPGNVHANGRSPVSTLSAPMRMLYVVELTGPYMLRQV